MAGLQEYKCPACGGALEFDSKSQKMKCPYCDTEYPVKIFEELDADLKNECNDEFNWDVPDTENWDETESTELRSYICNSCGGEIIGDENMAASSCPFCGNPVVVMQKFEGKLRPDFIIPFKLDKKAAKLALNEHLKGKTLLPKLFKDENHIDEIKGVYVPFWLFDGDVDAHIRYNATRIRSWSDSKYNYTETSYYSVVREGSLAFDSVPVDGSTKMPDDIMESIEPFHFSDAVDFQTAYLAGYLADKFDVDAQSCIARANQRITASTESEFASTVQGYTTVTTEGKSIKLSNAKAKYALYPVWLLNTTYNGKKYTFAMNGQTGKFVGDLPVDKGKYWRCFGIIAVAAAIVTYGLTWLVM